MKKLLLLFILIITSCQTTTKITEKEVMDSFDNFFDTVDNNLDQFGSIVTDDFFISSKTSFDKFFWIKIFSIVLPDLIASSTGLLPNIMSWFFISISEVILY